MSKICTILRGVSGCGKTTFAEYISALVANPNETIILSADDYFMVDGEYRFDGAKLKNAHKWCRESFEESVEESVENIILCNTNTQAWEFESYKEFAEEAGYKVFCIIVENRHGGKNTHGVPDEALKRMKDRFEVQL